MFYIARWLMVFWSARAKWWHVGSERRGFRSDVHLYRVANIPHQTTDIYWSVCRSTNCACVSVFLGQCKCKRFLKVALSFPQGENLTTAYLGTSRLKLSKRWRQFLMFCFWCISQILIRPVFNPMRHSACGLKEYLMTCLQDPQFGFFLDIL